MTWQLIIQLVTFVILALVIAWLCWVEFRTVKKVHEKIYGKSDK